VDYEIAARSPPILRLSENKIHDFPFSLRLYASPLGTIEAQTSIRSPPHRKRMTHLEGFGQSASTEARRAE
jgi:hypothetical protein